MDGQDKILSMFAYVMIDEDGTEGVPALLVGDMVMPMVGADLAAVKDLEPKAQLLAKESGKPVTLVHFSTRTVQAIYEANGAVTKLGGGQGVRGDEPPAMGRQGEYTGLKDKDGKLIHIGHVIRLDGIEKEPGYAFGRVWYMAPELCARRVDETTGAFMDGSFSLPDWGHGVRIDEFTLMEGHPGASWPVKDES